MVAFLTNLCNNKTATDFIRERRFNNLLISMCHDEFERVPVTLTIPRATKVINTDVGLICFFTSFSFCALQQN